MGGGRGYNVQKQNVQNREQKPGYGGEGCFCCFITSSTFP